MSVLGPSHLAHPVERIHAVLVASLRLVVQKLPSVFQLVAAYGGARARIYAESTPFHGPLAQPAVVGGAAAVPVPPAPGGGPGDRGRQRKYAQGATAAR